MTNTTLHLAHPLRSPGETSEHLDDVSRVRAVIQALVQHKCRATIQRAAGAPIEVLSTSMREDGELVLEIGAEIATAPMVIEWVGYNTVYRLVSTSVHQKGTRLTVVPKSMLRVRRRWLRRQAVVGQHQVELCIDQPGQNLSASGRIVDLSYVGVSIEIEGEAGANVTEGTLLRAIHVHEAASARTIRLVGEVRSVRRDAGRVVVGLTVRAKSDDDGKSWITLVDDELHPSTRTGSGYAEATWALYDRCGYFHLSGKNPLHFQRTKCAFLSVSRQLDRAPHIATQVVWSKTSSTDAVAGALSMLKVYSRSWFGFQIAKVSGDAEDGTRGGDVLLGLHLRAYEHIQRDPTFQWTVGYTQVKRVWSRLPHHDFPARFVKDGDASIIRFRALAFNTSSDLPSVPREEVREASRSDLDLVAERILATRPSPYVQGLDLDRAHLDLSENRAAWRKSRLERERQILVAMENGRPVAAAVLECASDGLHLYGLLELVRLYSLEDGGEVAFPKLLLAARSWFRTFGKDRFVCLLEEGQALPDDVISDAEDMGLADLIVFAARRVPELLEHLYELTAPKPKASSSEAPALGA